MKKHLNLVLGILLAQSVTAQINVRDNTVSKPVLKPFVYDSLSRFHYSGNEYERTESLSESESFEKSDFEVLQYLGQKVYFIPYDKSVTDIRQEFCFFNQEAKPVIISEICEDVKPFKYFGSGTRKLDPEYITWKKKYNTAVNKEVLTDVFSPSFAVSKYGMCNIPEGRFYTPHTAYQGQYFEIVNMEFGDQKSVSNRDKIRFVLEASNGDTVYFDESRQDWNRNRFPEFILLGYYEKQQSLYINQTLVYSPKPGSEKSQLVDINTGEMVDVSPGSEWACTSLDFLDTEDTYLQMYLILKNNDGKEIKIRIAKEVKGPDYSKDLFAYNFTEKSEWIEQQRLAKLAKAEREAQEAKEKKERELAIQQRKSDNIKKFGAEYGKLVNNSQVVVGMSKEMCIAAWGHPKRKNKTTGANYVTEQWVYSMRNYLYFRNGKLTTIQD